MRPASSIMSRNTLQPFDTPALLSVVPTPRLIIHGIRANYSETQLPHPFEGGSQALFVHRGRLPSPNNFKICIDMVQQKPESGNIGKSELEQQEKIIQGERWGAPEFR
jgi:hypothetical protein